MMRLIIGVSVGLLCAFPESVAAEVGDVICGEKYCAVGLSGCCDNGYDLSCSKNEEACLNNLGMWFPGSRASPEAGTMRCGDKSCKHEPGSMGCCDRGRGYKCAQSKKRCISRGGLWNEGIMTSMGDDDVCGRDKCDGGRSFVGCCDRGAGWLCEQSKYDCSHKDGIFRSGSNPYPKFLERDDILEEEWWVPVVTCSQVMCGWEHMGCCRGPGETGVSQFQCTNSKKLCVDSGGTYTDGVKEGVALNGADFEYVVPPSWVRALCCTGMLQWRKAIVNTSIIFL